MLISTFLVVNVMDSVYSRQKIISYSGLHLFKAVLSALSKYMNSSGRWYHINSNYIANNEPTNNLTAILTLNHTQKQNIY